MENLCYYLLLFVNKELLIFIKSFLEKYDSAFIVRGKEESKLFNHFIAPTENARFKDWNLCCANSGNFSD